MDKVLIRGGATLTVAALSALSAVVACSSSSGADSDPPAEVDAGVRDDASPSTDGGADSNTKPPCNSLTFDDSFATLDSSKWRAKGASKEYPKVDFPNGPDGGIDKMLALIEPFKKSTQGAVWLTTPVPSNAFDVSFEYFMACKPEGFCADGFAALWVDSTDPAELDDVGGGGSFGVPRTVAGGAASVSVAWDFAKSEGWSRPAISIHRVKPQYWYSPGRVMASTTNDAFVGTRHTVKLHLRRGLLSVALDGVPAVEGVTIGGFTGSFGFTGATGDGVSAFYVSSFHGEFYSCDPD